MSRGCLSAPTGRIACLTCSGVPARDFASGRLVSSPARKLDDLLLFQIARGIWQTLPCFRCFLVRPRGPFLRPDLQTQNAPRAAAVKAGRRPPPEAARSGLDGGEHGATLGRSATTMPLTPLFSTPPPTLPSA